ncbi:shikimate kinase [Arthrobacter sp. NEB 688]|uniref:shikimate kinase n=1 Tax=Arthrobacter sp. NEB 688 TaxID=904039 RepID=UPI001563FE02|nr:shikimate kinase [Arthrobacter sp. NEB 688]QKE84020.1 hypothetical protein HL663_08765 [Arthrobacter sp. NEB 688]
MVLTGPAGAGKTTVGREVASVVERPFVDLDAVAEEYYAEAGWSLARLRTRIAAVGRRAAETEWEPARAHAVVRAAADHPGSVLALGAGHTCYTDAGRLATVRAALRRSADVVRLLPSPDRDTSLRVLRHRCLTGKDRSWVIDGHDFLAQWLDDPAAQLLSTRTVYTGGETVADTARLLLRGA